MKIKIILRILAFLFSLTIANNIFAQSEHFRVMDGQTQKSVYGVRIKSLHEHDIVAFSNESGYFNIPVKHNDTLMISKDYYHPIFVVINMNNFDSLHIIVITMVPSPKKFSDITYSNMANLSSFEYHFVHDTLGTSSSINVKVLEPQEAIQIRQNWNQNSVKIGSINLEPVHVKHQTAPTPNYYLLKK